MSGDKNSYVTKDFRHPVYIMPMCSVSTGKICNFASHSLKLKRLVAALLFYSKARLFVYISDRAHIYMYHSVLKLGEFSLSFSHTPSLLVYLMQEEVFNILFVLSHRGEYLAYCHRCAGSMRKTFTVLQQVRRKRAL